MLVLLLIILTVVLVVVLKNPEMGKITGGQDFPDIYKLQKKLHEYSGLNKGSYMKYLTHMDNCLATLGNSQEAAGFLAKAIDSIRHIGLNLPAGDTDIPEELEKYSMQVGKLTEQYIMKYALQNGEIFAPKYLNDTFINIKEYD
tara:strand:+ start:311 stop:742 length:432 start_codon:yes stop_codon:yes gene_type:complete